MSMLTSLVLVAMLATIASFVSGIASMANHGEIAHQDSAHWMVWRVIFQAATIVMILLAVSGWH